MNFEGKLSSNLGGIISISRAPKEAYTAEEVIQPQYVVFSRGEGDYKIRNKNLAEPFELAKSVLREYANLGYTATETITEKQYTEAVSHWNSIVIQLYTPMPASALLASLNAGDYPIDGDIMADQITFSDAAKDSVILADKSSGNYTRVVLNEAIDAVNLFFSLDDTGSYSAYPSGDVFGGSNRTLVPLGIEENMHIVAAAREKDMQGDSFGQKLAELSFGSTFDFVRRISDTLGNTTYMYGYGKKTFYSGSDGVFEFKDEARSSETTGFGDDLNTALQSLEEYGGAKSLQAIEGLVLVDYSQQNTGRSPERTFCFAQLHDGKIICSESGYSFKVTVQGGQLIQLQRNAVYTVGNPVKLESPVFDAVNTIAVNSNFIYNVLNNFTLSAAKEEAFSYIADKIMTIDIAYYRAFTDSELVPCWEIRTYDNTRFYYGLYDGKPLGYFK